MELDLWRVLWNWRREFTAYEFISTFRPPAPYKMLHDMVKHGLLRKDGRGRYNVVSPDELVGTKSIEESYEVLKKANLKYALTDEDAVFLWTRGGYNVGRFFGRYPIHIDVEKEDVKSWIKFFEGNKSRYTIEDKPAKETWFGIFYCLHPNTHVKSTKMDGFSVLPLEDTVKFCRENIYTYNPALEMLASMPK